VEYVNIRADGRAELHIHGRFDLTDGGKMSFFADGVGFIDANGILQLRQNVTLKSNSPAHAWVNSIAVWRVGTANLATGEVREGIQGLDKGHWEDRGWVFQSGFNSTPYLDARLAIFCFCSLSTG
jgi:hypothetical protein